MHNTWESWVWAEGMGRVTLQGTLEVRWKGQCGLTFLGLGRRVEITSHYKGILGLGTTIRQTQITRYTWGQLEGSWWTHIWRQTWGQVEGSIEAQKENTLLDGGQKWHLPNWPNMTPKLKSCSLRLISWPLCVHIWTSRRRNSLQCFSWKSGRHLLLVSNINHSRALWRISDEKGCLHLWWGRCPLGLACWTTHYVVWLDINDYILCY